VATPTQKIEDLGKLIATLTERSDALSRDIAPVRQIVTDLAVLSLQLTELKQWRDQSGVSDLKALADRLKEQVDELRQWKKDLGEIQIKNDLVLLKEKVAKIEAAQEKTGNRLWMIVPPDSRSDGERVDRRRSGLLHRETMNTSWIFCSVLPAIRPLCLGDRVGLDCCRIDEPVASGGGDSSPLLASRLIRIAIPFGERASGP
jgi:hypothetical protein